MGVPIQNIVLANELSTTEEVVTEVTETKESAMVETNTSNSESVEKETESKPSEILLEEGKVLTDTPERNSSGKTESTEDTNSVTEQSEKRPSTKNVTTGTFPNGSTATWEFDDATQTLTISGGTLVNPGLSFSNLTKIPLGETTNTVLEDKVIASGNCGKLFSGITGNIVNLSNLDTSDVTNMNSMFYGTFMTSLDLTKFNTSKVTSMSNMFAYSAATSLDVSKFDTSNVTDMSNMFWESSAKNLDVSKFDTSKVTDMSIMFEGSAATSLDVSNFDTSNVTQMDRMFCRTVVTSLDLSSFDTSNISRTNGSMYRMFYGTNQLQNLTLGNNFRFMARNGGSIYDTELPDPAPTAKYTGKWQNVGSGTVDRPTGAFVGTTFELVRYHNGSALADTYVWQPTLLEVIVQDSILMVGDTWNPEDNFVDATDSAGDPVDFKDITVTGSVDTTQPGLYTVTYSYGGITSTATITLLEIMPASWINFFVDGTNVRSIPGSALSTPEWDLTTGLWDKWNPGTVKVPTDKVPSEPTKQGYEFKGWKDTAGTIVDFSTLDLDLNSQNEFNFYAAFKKKEYTLTFDVEGKQEQETVPFEDLVTEPTVPNKAGYAFTGWYEAKIGGTKWDFSTDKMPSRNMTLYARFNKLGFVTPEIKPVIPTVVTPITPGVDPVTPSVKPPTKPGERPNVVSPSTPGFGGNQISSNGSGSNTGNMTVTSQENTVTSSPEASQQSKLANLGEQNSMILQGFGLLMVISGIAFFWWKRRKKAHS
ncbi:BspA family leucine-rich repeat surface protein [Listeria monocytogenes]|uniref:BspA family leucine-rich repeat surface protein n=1 Tax=Listeria monocytogenes TaxID=1639 RepID=UPI00135A5ED5|nr:BspA family leucine-rich repeat surface protein [Listeria monocytogenes]